MIVSRWAARQANQDPNVTAEQLTETEIGRASCRERV